MVRPALISASSAPDTRPLKSWEMKLPQFSTCPTPASRLVDYLRVSAGSDSPSPRSAGMGGSLPRPVSGGVAQLAAEGAGVLHDAVARHDLDHRVVVVLALHVGGLLALHHDHRPDQLV